jgi:hypothetical protein
MDMDNRCIMFLNKKSYITHLDELQGKLESGITLNYLYVLKKKMNSTFTQFFCIHPMALNDLLTKIVIDCDLEAVSILLAFFGGRVTR